MMKKPTNLEKKMAKVQFGYKVRREFYNQIISLAEAGVSRTDSLRMIWDIASLEGKKPRDGLPLIVADIVESLTGGLTFGQSLKPWIPQDEFMAIEAIEGSSDFAGNLKEYLWLAEKQKGIRGKIIGGLVYPVFLLSISLGVVWYFGATVMPVLSTILPPEQWAGMAYLLYLLSIFATDYVIWFVLTLILTITTVVITLPRWSGMSRCVADKFPLYSTYRMYTGINFLTSISALAKSGMSLSDAIDRVRRNANPYVRMRVDRVLRRMLEGDNFGSAMYRAGTGWPDTAMALNIKVFAETQDLSEHMSRMAKEWLITSEANVEQNMGVLKYAAMILMFATIMTIIGGIYGINMQISAGAM